MDAAMIGNDANAQGDRWVGGVELRLGPDVFGPDLFWSSEQFERFRQSADTGSVLHNLRLLDKFWRTQPAADRWQFP